jgi:hypothetical protein
VGVLSCYVRILSYTFTDKLIVLESDSRLEDGDNNLDNTHALRTLDGILAGHDVLDLDIQLTRFNRLADKPDNSENNNSGNDIGDSTCPRLTKRQRSASPRCKPNLHYTSAPPLPQEEVEHSIESADCSDLDESGDNNFLLKRQKLSDPPVGRNASSSRSRRS